MEGKKLGKEIAKERKIAKEIEDKFIKLIEFDGMDWIITDVENNFINISIKPNSEG